MRVTGRQPKETKLLELSWQQTGAAAQVAPEPIPPPVIGEQLRPTGRSSKSAATPRRPMIAV